MQLRYFERFLRSYGEAPSDVRRAFDKQVQFLMENLRHPSLRAKKYDEARSLWQARVNRSWRSYFTIESDAYHLHDIIAHPR